MQTEQQRQQAEDRREAVAAQHHEAEQRRTSAEGERTTAEDRRAAMEEMRQVAEEMRDTREQLRIQEGEEEHTTLERRVIWIEEALRRLTERFTQLEAHLLHHIETFHHQSHEQGEMHREYVEEAWETIERSKQRVKDTKQLIGYTQEQMRKSHD